MYNTVGETAGVTQDVGSDPTVSDALSTSCTLFGSHIPEGRRRSVGASA